MKSSLRSTLALALIVGMPATALAQRGEDDEEYVDETTDDSDLRDTRGDAITDATREIVTNDVEADGPLAWSVNASSELLLVDNLDLRRLDETTDQDVLDTDDRAFFGHADIGAEVLYRPVDRVSLMAEVEADVLYPQDRDGYDGAAGALQVQQAAIGYDLIDEDVLGATLVVGRQPFELGGPGDDYVFAGIADAVSLTVDAREGGRVRALLVDLYGGLPLPESGYFVYPDGAQRVTDQRGETTTIRTGLVYEFDRDALDIGLTAKVYYFFASHGADPPSCDNVSACTGSDISFGGRNGNFRDRDYQHLIGGRLGYTLTFGEDDASDVSLYADYAVSSGVDRKALHVGRDVALDGASFGVGVEASIEPVENVELTADIAFYRFDGALYGSDGLEAERGFVGFEGARLPGLAVGRFAGWRPSSYLGVEGVAHGPSSQMRAAGTLFLHAALGVEAWGAFVEGSVLLLQDTGESFFDSENPSAAALDPPFGYVFEEFVAQDRLGESLGTEYDIAVGYRAADVLTLQAAYGVFVPGPFYDVVVGRSVAGDDTVQFADAPLQAFTFGAALQF